MGNFASVSAVGRSIERFLSASFLDVPPVAGSTTAARLVRTEDFDPKNLGLIQKPFLSVFPYRIDFNKTMRAGWSAIGSIDGRAHLPLVLHFLVTPWANDSDSELCLLGRAMQALETIPILTGPLLVAAGGFAPNETIQVVLEDVGTEAVMRRGGNARGARWPRRARRRWHRETARRCGCGSVRGGRDTGSARTISPTRRGRSS